MGTQRQSSVFWGNAFLKLNSLKCQARPVCFEGRCKCGPSKLPRELRLTKIVNLNRGVFDPEKS